MPRRGHVEHREAARHAAHGIAEGGVERTRVGEPRHREIGARAAVRGLDEARHQQFRRVGCAGVGYAQQRPRAFVAAAQADFAQAARTPVRVEPSVVEDAQHEHVGVVVTGPHMQDAGRERRAVLVGEQGRDLFAGQIVAVGAHPGVAEVRIERALLGEDAGSGAGQGQQQGSTKHHGGGSR